MVVEEGVVVSLTRQYLVTNLDNNNEDSRTLVEALAKAGVPQHGDRAPGNTNLAVHRQSVTMAQDSPTKAIVTIEYKTVGDYRNSFIFSGGTNLNQTQTDVDYFGNRISLSYTYPNDYPDENLRGQVYTTAINESVMVPHTTLQATGSLFVDYPNDISRAWAGSVNSTFWAGAPAGYWLCTACNFRPRDVGIGRPHLWEFDWTFEYNPQSWFVVAKIRDPNTGNVPDDVVDGVGIKQVDWYPPYDFNTIFGNT